MTAKDSNTDNSEFISMTLNLQREAVDNLSVILFGKVDAYNRKFEKILTDAEETYPSDNDFEKYEEYISERIDSADIVSMRNLTIDAKAYCSKVRHIMERLKGGFYLLFEKRNADSDYDYDAFDCMGFATSDIDAMSWVDANSEYRFRTYCPFKEVRY